MGSGIRHPQFESPSFLLNDLFLQLFEVHDGPPLGGLNFMSYFKGKAQ
jgi:hypothetical protein